MTPGSLAHWTHPYRTACAEIAERAYAILPDTMVLIHFILVTPRRAPGNHGALGGAWSRGAQGVRGIGRERSHVRAGDSRVASLISTSGAA